MRSLFAFGHEILGKLTEAFLEHIPSLFLRYQQKPPAKRPDKHLSAGQLKFSGQHYALIGTLLIYLRNTHGNHTPSCLFEV